MHDTPGRDLMHVVYRALVRESPVPSDPSVIGRAALAAMARRQGGAASPLPSDFGGDVERDAAFLARALPDPGPWWDVLAAMAWDSQVAHTAVTDEAFARGMLARLRGEPLADPGFVLWRQRDGRLTVADVDEAGSGHACGLRPGDVLEAVGGRRAGRANSEILPFYTAPTGAVFDLAIDRGGARQRVRLELASSTVACVSEQRLEGGVGHLRIRWFATASDPRHDVESLTRRALTGLVADDAPGLVIDVRSGLGGQLGAANAVISLVCDAPFVGAHRSDDGSVTAYPRTAARVWGDAPVAVLMNEQSISAGEYLALGLEELAGAVLVGTPTAGGLNALRFIDLGDGHRLALPEGATLGPRSREARSGFRLEPHVYVANPTSGELAVGADPALEAARRRVLGRRTAP